MKFFKTSRVRAAVTHLQQFDSNWVLVPLVLYVNGVNREEEVSLGKRHGTDQFLKKFFSGDLIGLPAFDNGNNSLRPRFSDFYANMTSLGNGDDYIYHQRAKLWANVYSSRGYRDMRSSGYLTGEGVKF